MLDRHSLLHHDLNTMAANRAAAAAGFSADCTSGTAGAFGVGSAAEGLSSLFGVHSQQPHTTSSLQLHQAQQRVADVFAPPYLPVYVPIRVDGGLVFCPISNLLL